MWVNLCMRPTTRTTRHRHPTQSGMTPTARSISVGFCAGIVAHASRCPVFPVLLTTWHRSGGPSSRNVAVVCVSFLSCSSANITHPNFLSELQAPLQVPPSGFVRMRLGIKPCHKPRTTPGHLWMSPLPWATTPSSSICSVWQLFMEFVIVTFQVKLVIIKRVVVTEPQKPNNSKVTKIWPITGPSLGMGSMVQWLISVFYKRSPVRPQVKPIFSFPEHVPSIDQRLTLWKSVSGYIIAAQDWILFYLLSLSLYRQYHGRGQIHWPGTCCLQLSCDWYQFHHHEKGICPLSSQTHHSPYIRSQLLQGLNDAAERNAYGAQASDNLSYLKNPIWWAGMSTRAFASSSSIRPNVRSSDLTSFCWLFWLISGLGWGWVRLLDEKTIGHIFL